jgi:isocitrate lyase
MFFIIFITKLFIKQKNTGSMIVCVESQKSQQRHAGVAGGKKLISTQTIIEPISLFRV